MRRIICLMCTVFVLWVCVGCAGETSSPTAIDVPESPSPIPVTTLDVVSTVVAESNPHITVSAIRVESTRKLVVSREDEVFYLIASDTSGKYGCELESGGYDTYGCYFPITIDLIDLDGDGELEIVSLWEHNGSGSYKSFHLHRWDEREYRLVGEFFQMQLSAELTDLDDDGRPEIVLRYLVGESHHMTVPWLEIYTLADGEMIGMSEQYLNFVFCQA